MKKTIKIDKEVDMKMLQVEAGVRHWEDGTVNGEEDAEGNLMPCREGQLWKPLIYIETGKIANWVEGTKASVHYKVCDAGSYHILDANGNKVLSIDNDYVPPMLCPGENGYGDYIIMEIDETGMIQGWEVDLSGFIDDEY